ncbi:MAG: WD40 repeat domain-containing protein [Anaerolineae bacterium]|nr:WD40 repeat domain-containing protein [Anaerolineae bacterium]
MIEAIVRRYAGVLLPLALLLSACRGTPLPVTDVFTPVPITQITTLQPTTTSILAPSSTPFPTSTPTPTPTPALPVLAGTPVPLPVEPITPQNADQIQELAIWGKGYVKHVTFSPDGKLLAVGTTIGIWLYDAQTFEIVRFIETPTWVSGMAFSADGSRLFAQTGEAIVWTWDTDTGECLNELRLQSDVQGMGYDRRAVVFSEGADLIAVSEEETIWIWNLGQVKRLHTLEGHTSRMRRLTFSPDAALLASSSLDRTVRVWDAQTGALVYALDKFTAVAWGLAFSPDGRILTTGTSDGLVQFWNAQTGELLNSLEGHLPAATSLVFSPDGKTLASGSGDRTIRLWDVETGSLVCILTDSTSPVETLAFTPDGKTLASSGQFEEMIRLWNVETGKLAKKLGTYLYKVTGLAVSLRNDVFVSYFSNNQIYLWNTKIGQIARTLSGHKSGIEHLALSADGTILASSVGNMNDPAAWIWDTATGQRLRVFDQDSLDGLALSPDGSLVAVGGYRHWTVVYEVETGQRRHLLNDDGAGARMAFSSNGTRLATAGSSASSVYDAETGELLLQMPVPDDYVLSALPAWSSDDRLLATGSYEGVVWLRNAETGEILYTWSDLNRKIWNLAFSPDDNILVVGRDGCVVGCEYGRTPVRRHIGGVSIGRPPCAFLV